MIELTNPNTLPKVDPDLLSLCRVAEQESTRKKIAALPISEATIAMAPVLYAKAVRFCDQGGFPYSSIRVEVASAGLLPANSSQQYKYPSVLEGTALRWNGSQWGAVREKRNRLDYGPKDQFGRAWVELENEPDKQLLAKKIKDGNGWYVKVAVWTYFADGRMGGWEFTPWEDGHSHTIMKEGSASAPPKTKRRMTELMLQEQRSQAKQSLLGVLREPAESIIYRKLEETIGAKLPTPEGTGPEKEKLLRLAASALFDRVLRTK